MPPSKSVPCSQRARRGLRVLPLRFSWLVLTVRPRCLATCPPPRGSSRSSKKRWHMNGSASFPECRVWQVCCSSPECPLLMTSDLLVTSDSNPPPPTQDEHRPGASFQPRVCVARGSNQPGGETGRQRGDGQNHGQSVIIVERFCRRKNKRGRLRVARVRHQATASQTTAREALA